MKSQGPLSWIVVSLCVFGLVASRAGTITIGVTPLLTASLPSNSTYQVESSSDGVVWNPTGILVAGNGTSNTVRLDGLPENLSYRFSNAGASNIVTPALTKGLHVGASFPGAKEVRIESTTQLNSPVWTNHAFLFTNISKPLLAPIAAPLEAQAFFRAVQPAVPLELATVTAYMADPNATGAGFGVVADDMPQFYRDGYIAALCPNLYNRAGANAAAAGECYELVGPQGKATVMIADLTFAGLPGTCDPGRSYFDVGYPAFTNLLRPEAGMGTATYRLVPAPVTGNLKMVSVNTAGGFYFELRPYNHRAGVSKLEIQGTGGSWTELPRTEYNSFVYSTGTELMFPFKTRVTSRFGEVVEFPPINAISNGGRFTASGQFTVFPDQGPSPIWFLPPVYADSLSNILGGQWSTAAYGGATVNSTYTGDASQGTASFRIENFNAFSGVSFMAPMTFPRPSEGVLEFAIRSEGAPINQLQVQFNGVNAGGGPADSIAVTLPTISSTWRVLRIPLDPTKPPDQLQQFRIMNQNSTAVPGVLLDSIVVRW
jgi:expansin (peptidoglycan-binding protein)